jgi:IPT/TIG domain-containing protein
MKLGGRAALLVMALTLISIAPARAAMVTLGPPALRQTSAQFACELSCFPGNTVASAGPASSAVAPADGVVTHWAVIGSGTITMRVFEPATGGGWRGAGTSSPATNDAGGENATELPIKTGDLIGVDVLRGTEVDFDSTAPGTAYLEFNEPPLAEGEVRNPPPETGELQLHAQIELNPVITSVSPASGSTVGGNTVTIKGKFLDSVVNVLFGSTPAVRFTVDPGGERITATAPASSAATVDVHANALHASSETGAADRYTFIQPPATTTTTTTTIAPGATGPAGSGAVLVNGFRQSASRWRRGSSPHHSSAPVGTSFAFSLNESASVSLTFTHSVPGRRAGGRCVAPNARNRGKAKCKRTVSAGTLAVSGHTGPNTVRFQGRLSNTLLAPGSYSVRLTARDSHGVKNLTQTLSFTIVG